MNRNHFPRIGAEEAAQMIKNGQTVAFSGFTAAGAAKALPKAIAKHARELHRRDEKFKLRILSGASTGNLDDLLAEADAVAWRAPYQSSAMMREKINSQQIEYTDMNLSRLPQMVMSGFLGNLDWAVIEATEVTADGRVYLSTSIGASPTFLNKAERVIVELNRFHSIRLSEMADICLLPLPPARSPLLISDPLNKIGLPYAAVDPKKIAAIVENDEPDGAAALKPPDEVSTSIAEHIVLFFKNELREGRIPPGFLPLQAGVGNIANSVMSALGNDQDIPPFKMYTEVFQDALLDLMEQGHLIGASTCSLSICDENLQRIYDNMNFFNSRIVLRPQDISNSPEVIRRLGVIALNTAFEFDLYGQTNSTHSCGTDLLDGIGGSGDFMNNAYLSIFMAPSVARDGSVSTIVPMVTHSDHNEHAADIFVTEQGLADVRGLDPREKAKKIIDNCAHPDYRYFLHSYLSQSQKGHIGHDFSKTFKLHESLLEKGTMKYWE